MWRLGLSLNIRVIRWLIERMRLFLNWAVYGSKSNFVLDDFTSMIGADVEYEFERVSGANPE